jgi:hypothetical protein
MAAYWRSVLAWSMVALLGGISVKTLAEEKNAYAPPTDAVIHFNRDIRPIFSNRCFKCHGPDLKKAGLDLQSRESSTNQLKSGNIPVVPGKSAESQLIERVSSPDEHYRMPPQRKGERLTTEQIDKLRAWIDQGAKWEEHWAYVRPERHPLPAVRDKSWPRNDLDYFVLARLEGEGLSPSPEADRTTLIRRVTLDLTGLPPSLEEVDAFLADAEPKAYEKVVDRLLASPHYGERQARPWLDQARYADTNGYEKDERRAIWPYRDWVIDAYNRDLPFDRFTIEQIAGDLLPGATAEQKIATGFHRNTMVNTEGGTDDEEFRVAALVDRVNTTMAVWMGTTFGCAQCHNHKFDPFSQADYYRFLAFFNSTEDRGRSNEPSLSLPTTEQSIQQQKIRAEIAKPRPLPLFPNALSVAALVKVEQSRLAALRKQEADLKITTTLVMRELSKPRVTNIMIRGNHTNKGEVVAPGVPAKLHPLTSGQPADRLALAWWLVDPDNPLVGRVTMNRLWAQYFGRGLVETSEDFGAQGEPPTHPELLDWLATELIRQNWSLKAMHRLVVTSATYRQVSRTAPALFERDPFNRLLGRGPRLRLEAEMVRDNALAISGLRNRQIGGPSVFPYQPEGVWFNPYSSDKWVVSTNGEQYRRGLYTFWRRTAPYAAFMAFDAPSREVCCERRPRTNTPLQALATLNDKAFVEPAAALARRMMLEVKSGDRNRAVHGFRLCLARRPSAMELDHLLALYRDSLEKYRNDPNAAQAMARSGLPKPPKELGTAELAAWTVVANVLLNLDETITKG